MQGPKIRGLVDGQSLAEVEDRSHDRGLASLASTYDRNLFDNVRVEAQ
jgi:hypothetical protein